MAMMKKEKRIAPRKRMKRYEDFGDDIRKVKWTNFIILVPSEEDKKEIQAAMEYFHNMPETDTGFVTVNQLVHEYNHGEGFSRIVVDKKSYNVSKKRFFPS